MSRLRVLAARAIVSVPIAVFAISASTPTSNRGWVVWIELRVDFRKVRSYIGQVAREQTIEFVRLFGHLFRKVARLFQVVGQIVRKRLPVS